MDFEIPDEWKMLQNLTKQFVEEELRPLEKEMEEKEDLPDETWDRLESKSKELGLWAPFAPEEYGGGGINSYLALTLMNEVMGTTCIPFRVFVGRGMGGTRFENATEYQRKKFFIPVIKGEKHSFAGITEPNAGSDQRAIQTTAVRDGDEWVINGVKHLISGVYTRGGRRVADFATIYCLTDREARRVTPFLVEIGTPGFTIGRRQKTMGTRGVFVHELYFDDCRVPDANRLGGEGTGLRQFLTGIGLARVEICAYGVGAAQYCLDKCVDFSKQRITFGQPLSTRQAIQWMLVDSWMEIETTRWLLYRTAWGMDQGEEFLAGYSACKILGSQLACRVADRAIQIHGGVGYTTDLPFERIYRDFRGSQIYEGANEIHKFIIARILLGERPGRLH